MDKHFRFSAILLAISFSMLSFTTSISASERKINMNQHWKFYHGCIANAEQPSFNDSGWRVLDIPHDWSVEPLPVQREGWYRKELILQPGDTDKILSLYFEGAYNQTEVWINGQKACFNAYGYIPFRIDINKYCNAPGIPNTIAVKVITAMYG